MECQRCGTCCKSAGVWIGKLSSETIDYLQWGLYHDGIIMYSPMYDYYGIEYPKQGCNQYEEKDGQGTCKIFETRPAICKNRVMGLNGCIEDNIKRFNSLEELRKEV